MAIELTYHGDASADEIDRALLAALSAKDGYVVGLTYIDDREEDVVIDGTATNGETLYLKGVFDENTGGPVGARFAVDRTDILAVKVY